MDSYRSLLESKEKLILTMKKSNENLIPLDFSPVDEQFHQLIDTFHVNIFKNHFFFSKFLFSISKSMNKHLIGKINSINIHNYGKIFINVYKIYNNGSIKHKILLMKNMMIMLI
jgi:hypothetical protein